MTIARILDSKGGDVVTVAATATVQRVVELLHQHRIGAVLVVGDDSRIAGVVSERDIIRCLHERGATILDSTAADLMSSPVVSVALHDSTLAALALMTERRIRHLPVLDGERVAGIVSIGDLVKRRIDDIEAEAGALKDYIAMA